MSYILRATKIISCAQFPSKFFSLRSRRCSSDIESRLLNTATSRLRWAASCETRFMFLSTCFKHFVLHVGIFLETKRAVTLRRSRVEYVGSSLAYAQEGVCTSCCSLLGLPILDPIFEYEVRWVVKVYRHSRTESLTLVASKRCSRGWICRNFCHKAGQLKLQELWSHQYLCAKSSSILDLTI